ncbi:MAG: MFS transporter [Chloroflexota bacterium]
MPKSEAQTKETEHPPDHDSVQPYQRRYRWVMLALVWLSYFSFGVIIRSMPPLVTPILRDLNISYSQMGLILGSWPLPYMVLATFAGIIMDRWGIRKSVFVGILIVGISEVLRFFASGFATLLLAVALFGVGGPMISIGCPKVASVWFRGKGRGTAVGTYMTGPSFGGLLSLSTANSVVMPLVGHSWRWTFIVFSLVAFTIALIWWFLARDVKSDETKEERVGIVQVFSQFIRVRNIQVILIMVLLTFSVSHGTNDWLPKILESGGLSPKLAGFAASIPYLTGIPSLLIIPRLVSPRWRGRVISLNALIIAAAILVMASQSGGSLIAGLALYGGVMPLIGPLMMLTLMDLPEVGPKYMGSLAGLYFCITGIGGFSGPFSVGIIKDLSGSFLMGAGFLACLLVILSILPFFLKTKPMAETKA